MLVDEQLHPVAVALDDRRARRGPRPTRRRCRRPPPRGGAARSADFSASISPSATTRPRLTITTSSHTSSTRSSWCELNTTPTPAAARSRRTSVIVWTPSGSRPENGSSRTSSSGSWTSAVASWIRCWLPWDRSSSFDFARSARPNRSSQTARAAPARRGPTARGAGRSTPAARRRASAGRARAARACSRTAAACPRRRRCPSQRHLAGLGDGEPEDAAHRRRLAGAVGPEEAEQPAAARRQRRTVERRDAAVVLGQAPDLEHRRATIADPVERATTPTRGAGARVGAVRARISGVA